MRRLQILMDPELDDALERLSAKERKSKSALIRDFVREKVKPLPPLEKDPIWQLVGRYSFEPVPPEDIDRVVYVDEYEREAREFMEHEARRRPRRSRAKR